MKKGGFVQANKKKNAVCLEKNKKKPQTIPGWAVWRSILGRSVPNDLFSHSQEAAQSPDTFLFFLLLLLLLLIPSWLSIAWVVSIPDSGGRSQSEADRNLFGCPCPPETSSRGLTNTSVPFFVYDPHSSGTSSRGSRFFFYFEVEFLHLCLNIKKNKKITCKHLTFIQVSKKKQYYNGGCVTMALSYLWLVSKTFTSLF